MFSTLLVQYTMPSVDLYVFFFFLGDVDSGDETPHHSCNVPSQHHLRALRLRPYRGYARRNLHETKLWYSVKKPALRSVIVCYVCVHTLLSCVFKPNIFLGICELYGYLSGLGSSVGIVTDYGLDGPGSNPSGDEIFCHSRSALGPTQPPVKLVPSLSGG